VAVTPSCEWAACADAGTHTVTIDFPGESQEVWTVCRLHDRALKTQAVASRPKAEPPEEEEPTTLEVCCGECERPLAEPSGLPVEQRQPCPACGSLKRLNKVGIHSNLSFRESVRLRTKRAGKGGWMQDTWTGDDYTRMLEGWGKRERTVDRENGRYREVIELHDGTRIVSVARLSDHRG
jgi:hypothetical protein